MAKVKQNFGKGAAFTNHFLSTVGTDPLCTPVRADVDAVMSASSDGGITNVTPNDHLLVHYMWPEAIAKLYLPLNHRLTKYANYMPFKASDFDDSSTVGNVREQSYIHCQISCPLI